MLEDNMQIIGRLEGEGLLYLRGKRNGSILDLGEAHQTDDGFWYFSEPYEDYPQIAIWAIAQYLYRLNHAEIVIK